MKRNKNTEENLAETRKRKKSGHTGKYPTKLCAKSLIILTATKLYETLQNFAKLCTIESWFL
jgi:hypothetical protein